jgi:hypothetical protein
MALSIITLLYFKPFHKHFMAFILAIILNGLSPAGIMMKMVNKYIIQRKPTKYVTTCLNKKPIQGYSLENITLKSLLVYPKRKNTFYYC